MKKQLSVYLLFSFCCIGFFSSNAQSVLIDPSNTNTAVIEPNSTTKGVMLPRMTEAQRNAILTPTVSTQVYCTNCTAGAGPYIYNGSGWIPMFTSPPAAPTYVVGEAKQGGIIFYIDESGQHGLAVATVDAGEQKWLNTDFKNTTAVRAGIYAGQYNTNLITENQGNGTYAAMVAAEYMGGGFGDWYLPSKEELNVMYQQRASIGMGSNTYTYWTSTEVLAPAGSTSETAYIQAFSGGVSSTTSKNNVYKIRAIRRF